VLAVAQGGRHENGRETHGNSMLIDPWGKILDRKLKGPGVVIGNLERVTPGRSPRQPAGARDTA
jgi:predicted amidohydrolase